MHSFKFAVIALLLCVCVSTIAKTEHYFGSSVSTWNYKSSDSLTVLNSEELLENFSDNNMDIEKGCRCNNGRCEKLCVLERNGVCRKTGNVCVCGPEFVKINDETCIYCDCGKGFNCTFYHVNFTCVCPEGFYIRDDKCVAMCSESHSCQNGGICMEGKCKCNTGTSGVFCEHSDWCATKCNQPLLTECVYEKEIENFGCLCQNRSLVYDFKQRICKPCLCGAGTCKHNNGELSCLCDPGYIEFNGQCRPCDCGNDAICELTEKGEKTCDCREGDFAREGKCLPCDCGHRDAKCETNKEGRKVCKCPYGYEDILGQCIKMNKDDRRCLCHPTANCVETNDEFNEFNCTCNEGYRGKVHDIPLVGEECIDIDECQDSKNCPDKELTECFNFEGSYLCRCKRGYQPIDQNADSHKTACEKYKISWAPTGIAIGIIVAFIAIAVGVLLYLNHRPTSGIWPSSGIEMQYEGYTK